MWRLERVLPSNPWSAFPSSFLSRFNLCLGKGWRGWRVCVCVFVASCTMCIGVCIKICQCLTQNLSLFPAQVGEGTCSSEAWGQTCLAFCHWFIPVCRLQVLLNSPGLGGQPCMMLCIHLAAHGGASRLSQHAGGGSWYCGTAASVQRGGSLKREVTVIP